MNYNSYNAFMISYNKLFVIFFAFSYNNTSDHCACTNHSSAELV